MEVITTHINADFDSLGSMLAAKKLYPNAVLVFPGSQEKSLRRFFLESVLYTVPFEKLKGIDMASVTRLILVDIRQWDRIGRFQQLVDDPNVEVHVYDHHPPTGRDIQGDVEVYKPYGASVTLMVELLQERSISLAPEEATVLMLGIYEDTGSLTFSSTTVNDLQAAAYLLECGADLNAVSNLITPEFTQEQVGILNELIQTRKVYTVHGIEVNVAEASADGYVGDLAVLVHKLKDMENLNVLFVLARMENRIFFVGRSRIPEVDVGAIARDFGGGGHPSAASATVKDLTLFQIREHLLALLSEHLKPRDEKEKVRDHMTFPVKSMRVDDTIAVAAETLNRYNINSLPVLEGELVRGILTRQVVEKACYHGLKKNKVSEIMSSDFVTLSPDDPLRQAQDLLLRGVQRFIPVLDEERLVGVLSRTDLLRSIASSLPTAHRDPLAEEPSDTGRERRVARLMRERLPAHAFELLKEFGEIAESLGMHAYLVGGVVRDCLMRRDNLDIDIVVEGDGLEFAQKICERYEARKRSHERFGTARVVFPDGFQLDVATARLEYYEKPASLPNVEWSSLKLDLYRRDFTMNTLAVRLDPARFGELVDFFGGEKDIKDKVVRIIQNLSFIEDPTRIYRALRFSERFGFSLGPQTRTLMQNAIQMGLPEQLNGRRLLGELKLILKEERPKEILERMQELDLLRVIHPDLILSKRVRTILENARQVSSWFRFLYLDIPWEEWLFNLLCLLALLDDQAVETVRKRLSIVGKKTTHVLKAKGEGENVLKQMVLGPSDLNPGRIYHWLYPLPIEVLLFLMTKTSREKARKAISLYITKLRSVRVSVTGKDLAEMGYEPGPQYREILEKVMDARLNGLVTDRDTEKEWIVRHFPPQEGPPESH
jgi:tRNA nucleotidyltransferase (CCA-adding enzyme)